MQLFTILFSSLSIIITFLPLIKTGAWWIRIFDYPRMQITFFIAGAVPLVLYYIGYDEVLGMSLLLLLAFALVYQVILMIKYTPIYPIQAKKALGPNAQNTIRILESNIRMQNKNVQKLIYLVNTHKPHVVVVNEPNVWWEQQLQQIEEEYPYVIRKPLENTYGMLLFSKLPLKNIEINFLVRDDIPSFYASMVLPSGAEVDLHCLHPQPPMPGSPTYERDTEILLIGKRVKKSNKPAIVVGDLNDVAWSHTSALFQRYSGLLDPRQGRGLFNTYNVFMPLFRYPLDHFFYSKQFGLVSLEKLESVGSDHFPMLLEVIYEGQVDHAEEKPQADHKDIEEVKEKIEEGKR